MKKKNKSPRILLIDIETSPIIGFVWGLWDNNLGLNQIKQDWNILSVAAKWYGEKKVFYYDNSRAKNVHDDKKILENIIKLLDKSDIVIGHNIKKFDHKKINARCAINKLPRPAPYKIIDTLTIAKKHFALTSNKLEYLVDKLCGVQKSPHKKFPGQALWTECLKGNKEAWAEMKKYNVNDVIILEKLYKVLQKWDNTINFDLYSTTDEVKCNCGNTEFIKRGFSYTNDSKFQRFQCVECKSWYRGKVNLFSEEKRKSLKRGI